ncbi:MAG: ribosome biosis GTPase / thiamine phosphate phosphatase [Petroclostridium sp.]|nr:ribosome biosis GTPase / thiamine phosphate phosphatase [Petroclostridium sp.]
MPRGIILKGIGGFYYVKTEKGIVECKARGKLRKDDVVPMAGDYVEVQLSQHDEAKGSIENIFPRTNSLIRPPVANVEQLIIVVAVCCPDPNLLLLDKFIIAAESKKLDIVICLNKIDLDKNDAYIDIYNAYLNAGYKVICTSTHTCQGIDELRGILKGKVTVFAGASGVGKSSLLNAVDSRFKLQTGEMSKKIERGKHTTRHVELLELEDGSYVVDTPGFSSFDLLDIKAKELDCLFKEFREYVSLCKFRGCSHTSEPGCAIIEAVNQKKICGSRYQNYLQFYNQLKNVKEWKK